MNKAIEWIDQVRGNDSLRGVARAANLTHAKLIRQVNDDQLTFDTVKDVSRAYGRPIIADLVATGLLTAKDAGVEGMVRALQSATDEQLVSEIGRRLNITPSSTLFDAPISDAIAAASNVSRLDDHRTVQVEDELAVASDYSEDRGEDGDGYDA